MPAATAELDASDYRKIVDVLESCEDAADVNEFRHDVVAAVSQVSGIAATLVLTEDTVKKYVSRALAATGCRTRTELAVRALSD